MNAFAGTDSIRFGPRVPGLERAEVYLTNRSFEPHRHDVYAIGMTTAGVHTFRYRGERRVCLPGQVHILHPDETHDGGAGTEGGFGYRILYIAPDLIRGAADVKALPFVADPVHDLTRRTRAIASALSDIGEPISEIRAAEIAASVVDMLLALTRSAVLAPRIDFHAMALVRDQLDAHPWVHTPASLLEHLTGLDRFAVARQFRRVFGTTPDRYRTMRRLALTRTAIESGQPLATIAADFGFSDQSHMTRQFKRAFGVTPGRWAALTARARG